MRNVLTISDEERATLSVAFISHGVADADLDFQPRLRRADAESAEIDDLAATRLNR